MTEPSPVSRRELLDALLRDGPVVERTRIVRVELPPGQKAGRHRHPCHVVGYVLSGAIRFQVTSTPPGDPGRGRRVP